MIPSGADFETFNGNLHRTLLWRQWDEAKPMALFIGLNPSKADAVTDDMTITKCRRFAADNGYGGFYMMNLFTLVSTKPKALVTEKFPIVDQYYIMLRIYGHRAAIVIFCWGAFPEAVQQSKGIIEMFPEAYCLGKTKSGFPKHPCRLGYSTKLEKFNQNA